INGIKAYMLLDTGSTTLSVTPEFARIAELKVFALKEQITLYLGCVGSRSKINFGAYGDLQYDAIETPDEYFDIINVDRYDGIVGITWMRRHGLILD
ncbi:hypothetical protein PENSPDRAFT_545405, partial [Peniophora sp. CONT]